MAGVWSPLGGEDCSAALTQKDKHRVGPQYPSHLFHLNVKIRGITVTLCLHRFLLKIKQIQMKKVSRSVSLYKDPHTHWNTSVQLFLLSAYLCIHARPLPLAICILR